MAPPRLIVGVLLVIALSVASPAVCPAESRSPGFTLEIRIRSEGGARISARVELPGPTESARLVLTDYEHWPDLFPPGLRIVGIRREASGVITDLWAARHILPGELHLVTETRETAPGLLETSFIEGDFHRYSRTWRLSPGPTAQTSVANFIQPPQTWPDVGAMTPLWLGEHLLLARRSTTPAGAVVQGCLLDWSFIRQNLLEGIRDLLPQADLAPAPDASEAEGARLLAALPVRLVVPPAATPPAQAMTPLTWSLVGAWVSLVMAAMAVLKRMPSRSSVTRWIVRSRSRWVTDHGRVSGPSATRSRPPSSMTFPRIVLWKESGASEISFSRPGSS